MGFRITADDLGMTEEINSAISELAERQIVSKVSVMAEGNLDLSLEDLGAHVEAGLHFNLTLPLKYSSGQGIELSPLKLLFHIVTGRLSKEQIMGYVEGQFEALVSKGFKFSYLDTHQHIHIIPFVLTALITFAKDKGIGSIRCITMEPGQMLFYLSSFIRHGFFKQVPKMLLLYALGGIMKTRLDREGIEYSRNLVLMPLAVGGDYPGLLKCLIERFRDSDVEIVTHPGMKPETIGPDGYGEGRYIEYSSLLNLA